MHKSSCSSASCIKWTKRGRPRSKATSKAFSSKTIIAWSNPCTVWLWQRTESGAINTHPLRITQCTSIMISGNWRFMISVTQSILYCCLIAHNAGWLYMYFHITSYILSKRLPCIPVKECNRTRIQHKQIELNWILASTWCQTNQCFPQIGEYHNQHVMWISCLSWCRQHIYMYTHIQTLNL